MEVGIDDPLGVRSVGDRVLSQCLERSFQAIATQLVATLANCGVVEARWHVQHVTWVLPSPNPLVAIDPGRERIRICPRRIQN